MRTLESRRLIGSLEVLHDTYPLNSETEQALCKLYADCRQTSPYCHPLWVDLLGSAFDCEAGWCVIRSGGEIVAAMPYLRKKLARSLLIRVDALPYDCYASPLLSPTLDRADAACAAAALYRFLASRGAIARFFPAEWLGEDTAFPVGEFSATRKRSEDVYLKQLSGISDEKALLSSYNPHHRKQVNTANKSPLDFYKATTTNDLNDFYHILSETMTRAGHPVKFPFESIVSGGMKLIEAGVGVCYLSKIEGRCCAGVFVLRSKETAIYWLGATTSDKELLRHRPAFGLFHRAMIDSVRAGAQIFELGAAPTQGLLDFKRRWGATATPQTTYTVGNRWILSALDLRAKVLAWSAR